MEDRVTPALYLELGNRSAAEAGSRADALRRSAEVERVTWWENCVPGREDLPRKVAEGSSLIVAEVTDSFRKPEAPTEPSGLSAHHFRRHRRPSQGSMTGRPTLGLLIVWISPRSPELASPLRDWGDFTHIRHIAEAGIPGFTQISVYENTAAEGPTYMHFYEFDAEEPEQTFRTMTANVAPRLGGDGSNAYADWADWRAAGGRLFYCNTFRLGGEAPSGPNS